MRRKAIHWPDMRKRMARKACAMFSGRTNWEESEVEREDGGLKETGAPG